MPADIESRPDRPLWLVTLEFRGNSQRQQQVTLRAESPEHAVKKARSRLLPQLAATFVDGWAVRAD